MAVAVILAVDFGTVYTVGVLGGPPRPVTVDGVPWIPSSVYAGDDGLVVGVDAVELGRGSGAARFERSPKTRIVAETASGSPVPVAVAVRAVLERMVAAARAQGGAVEELVLTHPASWRDPHVAVLTGAAHGLARRVRAVAEPVAAAAGHGLAVGQAVLVVDVGAAYCEVAAVRRGPAGFTVLAGASLADAAGDAFDARIVERVHPSLSAPADSPRDRRLLLDSARTGKEVLSRHESTEIVLPDHRAVRLDRAEFEGLIAADVERLVASVAGIGVAYERVLLVGGSSRVPLVSRRLVGSTGRPVVADPEPETAVARGALLLCAGERDRSATSAPAPPRPSAPAPPRRSRRGGVVVALVLVVLLVVAVVVLLTGGPPGT